MSKNTDFVDLGDYEDDDGYDTPMFSNGGDEAIEYDDSFDDGEDYDYGTVVGGYGDSYGDDGDFEFTDEEPYDEYTHGNSGAAVGSTGGDYGGVGIAHTVVEAENAGSVDSVDNDNGVNTTGLGGGVGYNDEFYGDGYDDGYDDGGFGFEDVGGEEPYSEDSNTHGNWGGDYNSDDYISDSEYSEYSENSEHNDYNETTVNNAGNETTVNSVNNAGDDTNEHNANIVNTSDSSNNTGDGKPLLQGIFAGLFGVVATAFAAATGKPQPEKPSGVTSGNAPMSILNPTKIKGSATNTLKTIDGKLEPLYNKTSVVYSKLSGLPAVGKLFAKAQESKLAQRLLIPTIIALLYILPLLFSFIVAPSPTTVLTLPDEGETTISLQEIQEHDDGSATATIMLVNTGAVISETYGVFDIYSFKPTVNPLSWAHHVKVGECTIDGVTVDEPTTTTVTCDMTGGVGSRTVVAPHPQQETSNQ